MPSSYIQSYSPDMKVGKVRPSWMVGDLGTMFKRESPVEPNVCVREGGVCLFRGGLVGAAVKLHCCPGAKCVFWGRSFTCVMDSDIKLEKEISREEYFSATEHEEPQKFHR